MEAGAVAVAWGLRGVVATETAIARVDGEAGELVYRGLRASELAGVTSFEAAAFLLWTGRMPSPGECAALEAQLRAARSLPAPVTAILDALAPGTDVMSALRTGISALGAQGTPSRADAVRFTAAMPALIGRWAARQAGRIPAEPPAQLTHVPYLLWTLDRRAPDPPRVRALEAYLVLAMEHGLNASTLAARTVASTRSDMASALTAAVGALKGPLHGGAPAAVHELLAAIPDAGAAEAVLRSRLAGGERLMGFGHRVYRTRDPRAVALRQLVMDLAGDAPWLRHALAVEAAALRLLAEHRPGRRLATNVEYWAAAVLRWAAIEPALYPAVFAAARVVGWCAHVLEQVDQDVLIRPEAAYTGPLPPARG